MLRISCSRGGDLANVQLRNARFENVVFRRTDLTRSIITESVANNVLLQEVILDSKYTRLELRGLDPRINVIGLRVLGQNMTVPIYEPEEVLNILIACGAIERPAVPMPLRKVPEKRIRVLSRFMRAYNRANPLCTSDENLRSIFGDVEWPILQSLLLEYRIVTTENKDTGGRRKLFLRRQVLPEEFMAGMRTDASVPAQVRQFWEALEKKA